MCISGRTLESAIQSMFFQKTEKLDFRMPKCIENDVTVLVMMEFSVEGQHPSTASFLELFRDSIVWCLLMMLFGILALVCSSSLEGKALFFQFMVVHGIRMKENSYTLHLQKLKDFLDLVQWVLCCFALVYNVWRGRGRGTSENQYFVINIYIKAKWDILNHDLSYNLFLSIHILTVTIFWFI